MDWKDESFGNSSATVEDAMIDKNDIQIIMDALMIRHWGMFLIEEGVDRRFNVSNSIFDAPDIKEGVVIAIAVPYRIESQHKRPAHNYGSVEPFAWGFDYHVEVKNRLVQMMLRIGEVAGKSFEDALYFVDNSPYNDREVAYHAGLGQVGFNHLLINSEYGTQFFIGYVIIKDGKANFDSIEAKAACELMHPFCSSCSKCVKACPTEVCGEKSKDMSLCLSSLTQTKASIDESYFPKMGTSIYGCSICQKVCPLNLPIEDEAILKASQSNWVDLFDLLDMNQTVFKKSFGHMGFSWRSLWVYKRNALIVLGNARSLDILHRLRAYRHLEEDPHLGIYYRAAIKRLEKINFEESDTY